MEHYFKKGFLDTLKILASRNVEDLPQVLVFHTGPWYALSSTDESLWILDHFSVDGKHKIYNYLNRIASKTTVIMLYPPSYKDYLRKDWSRSNLSTKYSDEKVSQMRFGNMNTSMMRWIAASDQFLIPKNVIFWDSVAPILENDVENCNQMTRILPNFDWKTDSFLNCADTTHTGKRANQVISQIFFNFLCN